MIDHTKALTAAWKSPNIGKRGPHKSTLLRRQATQMALEELKNKYKSELVKSLPEIIDVQMQEAKKPRNRQERESVLDRALGRPDEKPQLNLHLHKHEEGELSEARRKLIEEYETKLKELKTK